MALQTSRSGSRRVRRGHIRFALSTALGFAIVGWVLAAAPWVSLPSHTLRIWFFDIGQGDAIFIQTPTGEQILIDGGRDRRVLAKLGSVLPPWDRTLDAIILTHPDADHVGGLVDVLAHYEVDTIYETGITNQTDITHQWEEGVRKEGARHFFVKAGVPLTFGPVVLKTVWPLTVSPGAVPKDTNSFSIVLLLSYGETSVALTGDAEAEQERQFGKSLGDVDVLKAGHHGSINSSDAMFLSTVRAETAIISVGEHNWYGHPSPAVLDRLRKAGAIILRTDLDGDILLLSDGGEPELAPYLLPF